MAVIPRGTGVTESERYLAKIGEKTFLDLWSYSNTFTDKRGHATGDGKELCDLLVVFGNDVIIFSDKEVEWPAGDDVSISWRRWYKRAVKKSVDQVRGAERWILTHPDRIFLDSGCTVPFLISFPPADQIRIHCICVAVGAEEAAKMNSGLPSSWVLDSSIRDDEHFSNKSEVAPFVLGDVSANGSLVHVFDRVGLDTVMRELDTVADFCRYLSQREMVLRRNANVHAFSEADLLGFYLTNEDAEGRHVFSNAHLNDDALLVIGGGVYDDLIERPEYKAKVEENRISYLWDHLIKIFTETVLADTYITPEGHQVSQREIELGLRILASEERTSRRAMSISFDGVVELQRTSGEDRVTRIVFPISNNLDRRTIYVFMLLKFPARLRGKVSDDQYRGVRRNMLQAYAYAALYEHRDQADRIIGIAMNGPEGGSPVGGHSEDFILLEQTEWTPEFVEEIREQQKLFDVMDPGRLQMSAVSVQEYPKVAPVEKISRQQQRAAERAARKRKRKKDR